MTDGLRDVLSRRAARSFGAAASIEDLRRLPGGSSRETWSFDARLADGRLLPLILRRDPAGSSMNRLTEAVGAMSIDRDTERRVLEAVCAAGVPAPRVQFALADGEGGGFVMDRLAGETSARRIHRDEEYAAARAALTADCGRALARLHAMPLDGLQDLPRLGARKQIGLWRNLLDHFGLAQPVFEYAMNWLEDNSPKAGRECLVHGDFRLGNLMVGPGGLVAALDWELAHIGEPMEDIGWLCVRSWRFGQSPPVGGFGERETLYRAYEAAGGNAIDRRLARYWEIFGTLRWGAICVMQTFTHLTGLNRSVELAAIGRRISETEYDLLNLLEEA